MALESDPVAAKEIDPVLIAYADQLRKTKNWQAVNTAGRLIGGAGMLGGGKVNPLAVAEFMRAPTVSLSPQEVETYTKAINDLLKQKAKAGEKAKDNSLAAKQADIDARAKLLEQAVKLTEAQIQGNVAASSALAKAKSDIIQPMMVRRASNITDLKGQPVPTELREMTSSSDGISQYGAAIGMTDIATITNYVTNNMSDDPTGKAKLYKSLVSFFQANGLSYVDAMETLRQQPAAAQLYAKLADLETTVTDTVLADDLSLTQDTEKALEYIRTYAGDAAKIFEDIYASLLAAYDKGDKTGELSPEDLSDIVKAATGEGTPGEEFPKDDEDAQIEYYNKMLANTQPQSPTQHLKNKIKADPRFAAFKQQSGITNDDDALRLMLDMAKRGRSQQKALLAQKRGAFKAGEEVLAKPPVTPPVTAAATATPAAPVTPAAAAKDYSMFGLKGDDAYRYLKTPTGAVRPYDVKQGKFMNEVVPGQNPQFWQNIDNGEQTPFEIDARVDKLIADLTAGTK